MSKKFIFKDSFAKGGHIHTQKRDLGAAAQSVDGPGEHFFSGSGFTGDDDIVIGRRNRFHLKKNSGHGLIHNHHILERFGMFQIGKRLLFFKKG